MALTKSQQAAIEKAQHARRQANTAPARPDPTGITIRRLQADAQTRGYIVTQDRVKQCHREIEGK